MTAALPATKNGLGCQEVAKRVKLGPTQPPRLCSCMRNLGGFSFVSGNEFQTPWPSNLSNSIGFASANSLKFEGIVLSAVVLGIQLDVLVPVFNCDEFATIKSQAGLSLHAQIGA